MDDVKKEWGPGRDITMNSVRSGVIEIGSIMGARASMYYDWWIDRGYRFTHHQSSNIQRSPLHFVHVLWIVNNMVCARRCPRRPWWSRKKLTVRYWESEKYWVWACVSTVGCRIISSFLPTSTQPKKQSSKYEAKTHTDSLIKWCCADQWECVYCQQARYRKAQSKYKAVSFVWSDTHVTDKNGFIGAVTLHSVILKNWNKKSMNTRANKGRGDGL